MKRNNVIGGNNIMTKVCIMNVTAIGVILGLLIAVSSMWGWMVM